MKWLQNTICLLTLLLPFAELRAGEWPGAAGSIVPTVEMLIDPQRNLSFESAVKDVRWQSSLSSYVGFRNVDLWVRFTVDNPSAQSQELVLEDQWAMVDEITFYLVDHRDKSVRNSVKSGLNLLGGTRNAKSEFHRFPNARLEIPPGPSLIYVRYQNDDNIGCRLVLWKLASFRVNQLRDQWFLGLLLGFTLVMSLYNFCLYLLIRIRAYLYYSGYVALFFMFQLCMQGLAAQVLAENAWWSDEGVVIFAMVTVVFVVLFTKEFMALRQHFPYLSSLGSLVSVLSVLSIFVVFVDFQWASFLSVVVNLILVFWIFSCTFFMVKKRLIQGYIYALAWSLFVVGDTITILYYLGVLQVSVLTQWGMILGSTVEVVLLSFGLAYYVQQLRREMRLAKTSEAELQAHLDTAQSIQDALICREFPAEIFEMSAVFRAADTTAGDWYSVETSPDGRYVYVLIGDVTGHGISSALVSGAVSGAVSSSIQFVAKMQLDGPEGLRLIADAANRVVMTTGHASGRLMTLLLLCFDLENSQLHFLNAGHLNFYHIERTRVQTRIKAGSLLGFRTDPEWSICTCDFHGGDNFILFTDGLLENLSKSGDCLSQRELLDILKQNLQSTASETTAAVMDRADALWVGTSPQDDVTLISLKIEDLWESKRKPVGL